VSHLTLDHITIGCLDLAQGVAYAESVLGVPLARGGQHPLMGTHNHLLRLGDRLFLEVIAPDPSAGTLSRSRWFGLDDPAMKARLAVAPRLITWVVRTASIDDALATIEGAAGPAIRVTRGGLSWRIGVAGDGSMPFDGAFPTVIEWPEGVHPAEHLPDAGCSLRHFLVSHPDGERISAFLAPNLRDNRVAIRTASGTGFAADIETPHGVRRIA